MTFWVYILRCADGSYYTGHTDHLESRMGQHTSGAIASCYTFKRRPLTLAFSEEFVTREEALNAEQQIKGWSRKKKQAMMRGDWVEVSRLAHSAHAEPPAPVRPGPFDLAQGRPAEGRNPHTSVRPELVEGHPQDASQVPRAPSAHPSTGSGRTEGGEL